VCSETFDHTSVLRFLGRRFGVDEPNISSWRRSVCGDLTSAFDFAGTTDAHVPTIALPKGSDGKLPINVPSSQSMPIQEPGVRPARALGYAWTVEHRVEGDKSRLIFANLGTSGAAFLVYDGLDRDAPPRRYAVSAGANIVDEWKLAKAGDAFNRRIHGPNGYFAAVRGFAGDAIEAVVRGRVGSRAVEVALSNRGAEPVVCRVANAYSRDQPPSLTLVPGANQLVSIDLARSAGWYDIAITMPDAPRYLRRFAGHHEDGRPATSDPGPLAG
jgi:phospholipase C